MKKFIIGLLAVVLFASSPVMAGNISAMKVKPEDKAVVALLWMVYSDLQMCQSSMAKSIMDNVSAIGHLNNSQSALRKAAVDPAYNLLIGEIDKRISKIKFYLVMNERQAVQERIQQLMVIIRNVLGAQGGNLPNFGNNGNYNNNGGTFMPNGSGFVPVRPEIPVGGQTTPSMPVLPSGVVPVR
ncbi:MAG: hypothetical protein Kow0029_18920 [Candidatus Rifleibacteriota bacterium]